MRTDVFTRSNNPSQKESTVRKGEERAKEESAGVQKVEV